MKVLNKDILMEEHAKVDGRDLSKDGKVLDDATSQNIPATLVKRDNAGFSALTVSEAEKLKSRRRISLVGDITGSAYFDGTSSINIQTRYVNNRLDNYYPKPYIDDNFYRVSLRIDEIKNIVDSWKIEILRSGLGINYFTYNGTSEASISIDFQDISETSGTSTQVSRADHTHDNVYIKKTDIPNLSFRKDDFNLKLANLDGSVVYSEIKVPYALSLGFENGSKGYPLNSTELNNEPDKVVRTSSDGSVQFGEISTITNLVDDFEYVYVDSGDSKIRRTLKDNIYNHIYDYIDNNYLNKANKLFFENENQRCMSIENGVLKANDSTPLVIDNADKWTTSRNFNFNGVVTGSALVDGSADANIHLAFNSANISYPLKINTKGKLIYEPYSRGWGAKGISGDTCPHINGNVNLNTILNNGFYHLNEIVSGQNIDTLNRPSTSSASFVVIGDTTKKTQIAYCLFENEERNNNVFVRSYFNGTWTAWKNTNSSGGNNSNLNNIYQIDVDANGIKNMTIPNVIPYKPIFVYYLLKNDTMGGSGIKTYVGDRFEFYVYYSDNGGYTIGNTLSSVGTKLGGNVGVIIPNTDTLIITKLQCYRQMKYIQGSIDQTYYIHSTVLFYQ